jgi:hypothetical protein
MLEKPWSLRICVSGALRTPLKALRLPPEF